MNNRLIIVLLVLCSAVALTKAADVASVPVPASLLKQPVNQAGPLAQFRELLAMTSEQRQTALASRPEHEQKFLQKKLDEYDALPRGERELRLRSTELRYYLKPLMEMTPAQRAGHMDQVPADQRPAIAARLQQWDKLPASVRRDIQASDAILSYFSRPAVQRTEILSAAPPAQRQKIETQIREWEARPASERARINAGFQEFFQLPEKEQTRTLNMMPDGERRAMEHTLQEFEKLPATQRRVCIESFQKFASMTPEQRDQFLKSAERWKEMTTGEREQWRSLVTQLPPLPPGFYETNPTEMPPLPPGFPIFPPELPALVSTNN